MATQVSQAIWRLSLTVIAVATSQCLLCPTANAQQSEVISFQSRQKGRPVQVTATVYWPPVVNTAVPALMLHHGSTGVTPGLMSLAKSLSWTGVATVVIDSFKSRGVGSTVHDQNAVSRDDFNFDALTALKALGQDRRFDRTKIGIAGFSKGAGSSLMAAHERYIAGAGVPPGLRYAFHVAFYPSCAVQPYRPQTTGAPILLLLGGADTYVGVEPCQTYAEALRAGGALIDVKVFPNAPHGFDGGQPFSDPKGQNYSQCVYQEQPDGSWVERKSRVVVAKADGRWIPDAEAKAANVCRTLGVSGGPDSEAGKQAHADLRTYVQRYLLGR